MTPEQIEAVMGDPSDEFAFLRGANAAFIEEIEMLRAKNLDLCARIVKAMEIIAKARASIPVDHDWRNEWDFYMKDAFNVLSSDLFDQVESKGKADE